MFTLLMVADHATAADCDWIWTDPCTGEQSCYNLVEELQDFYAGELQCQLQHDGHLAAPTTEAENLFLRWKLTEKFQDNQNTGYRVGFGAFKVDGQWAYTSGETFDFTDWDDNQPSQDGDACVEFYEFFENKAFFEWHDIICEQERFHLCESKL